MKIGIGWIDSIPQCMWDDLNDLTDELKEKEKPNPNNYPIIDKWNYKYVFKPNMNRIFECVERIFNVGFVSNYKKDISTYADVVNVGFGDREGELI